MNSPNLSVSIQDEYCQPTSGKITFISTTTGRGFSLVELMIVLAIISILASMAIPIGNRAILRTKETVLKSNLHTLRILIDQYTADKLKAPQSLQDLVTAGYLREIPKDPITESAETW
jgi:general secretion pathway protein G